jgi:hypothetical protein
VAPPSSGVSGQALRCDLPDQPQRRLGKTAAAGIEPELRRFQIRRPLRIAAVAAAIEPANEMAGAIHRAIKEGPYEVREQYWEGDP